MIIQSEFFITSATSVENEAGLYQNMQNLNIADCGDVFLNAQYLFHSLSTS